MRLPNKLQTLDDFSKVTIHYLGIDCVDWVSSNSENGAMCHVVLAIPFYYWYLKLNRVSEMKSYINNNRVIGSNIVYKLSIKTRKK